jgi:predicted acyltransferase
MKQRILSIDIMRGLTLFLMLFVNDLYMPGVPAWLGHTAADFDGMGLADWVFPGFLFMVGMAVPFAVQSRLKKGHTSLTILYHILFRTVSLLIIGILMVNVSRLNPELTGIPKNIWAIGVYVSIFLVWNNYSKLPPWLVYVLKGAGMAGLIILAAIFKSGTAEQVSWLHTSWWGILGLIGWGYLAASLVYLLVKENLLQIGGFWALFFVLNILSQFNLLEFLNPVKPVLGVLLSGNTPSIVLAGLFFSVLIRQIGFADFKKLISTSLILGVVFLIAGFVLRQWFIISKIQGTPSWAMICNGISVLVFVVLYIIIDLFKLTKWTVVFKPAGQNSLTTYLAPDILYYSMWLSGVPILIYKQSEFAGVVILGSILWALAMVGFAALLARIGIRLRL